MFDSTPAKAKESATMDRATSRLNLVEEMRTLVKASKHLSRVFDDNWFNEVIQIVNQSKSDPGLSMPTHPAFIGFFHDAFGGSNGKNLLVELDEAFDTITITANRTLSEKLGRVRGNTDDYVSTVFELLVVNKFATRGLMIEYEPLVASGRPEAKILLDENAAIVEARATLDQSFPRVDGFYDPCDLGAKLAGKIAEKYNGQLKNTGLPTILIVGLNMNLGFEHLELGEALRMIREDGASAVLSAIVFADDYRAREFRVWINDDASFPLSERAQRQLIDTLGIKIDTDVN